MISVTDSSSRRGCRGPSPRISAEICSKRRARSGRERTIFSSLSICSNKDWIVLRTSSVLVMSSEGSSSARRRFCTRVFKSKYVPAWGAALGALTRRACKDDSRDASPPAFEGALDDCSGLFPWPCSIRFNKDIHNLLANFFTV